MSLTTMVLGESGTGKTTSLRNLQPQQTMLIQAVSKPLPFKPPGWLKGSDGNESGSLFVSDNAEKIVYAMQKTQRPIIVIDDFQYSMSNEFMRRSREKVSGAGAFEKFNDIAYNAWHILQEAAKLEDWKRVYIMGHTAIDDHGHVRAKTIGKLLDDKITIEGLVTIVLRTGVTNGTYFFRTRNDGADTTKTPMGMFDAEQIPNDLAQVDKAICEFYGINQPA